jgi:CRISPR-associated protein Cmr6
MGIKKISREEAMKNNAKNLQSGPSGQIRQHSERSINVSGSKRPEKEQRTKPIDSIVNLSYSYYRSKNRGKDLVDKDLRPLLRNAETFLRIETAKNFDLVTTYPGLLIGAGYAHPKLKENNDDFQLGFFFDHTTGLPVIPGSSVKGLLRSVAPVEKDDPLKEAKKDYMQAVYKCDEALIKEFCNCFDDQTSRFYDAYPVATEDKNGRLFADDYITPHGDNLTEEPNPIRFLKIRPGVTFRFQFDAAPELVDLFAKFLTDRGIGAKTNVGYGQMIPPSP